MKVSSVILLASVALAADKVNNNERTVTITKSGWDPKATNVYGRFDHTTRLHTTTVWAGSEDDYFNIKRAEAQNGTVAGGATNGTAAGGAAGASNGTVIGGGSGNNGTVIGGGSVNAAGLNAISYGVAAGVAGAVALLL